MVYVLLAALFVAAVFCAFEYGRLSAGYATIDSALERHQLGEALERSKERIVELEAKVSQADVANRVDKEAHAQIEKSVADLDARLGEQAQELAFYKSIVSPKDGAPGLRIARLQLLPATKPLHYRLRIAFVQGARAQGTVSGTLTVSVDGQQGGMAVSLPLDLAGEGKKELNFALKSFQELEPEIALPADFVPQRVQVEARPRGAEAPLREAVPWKVETA
jgi:hypothetical protein